MLKVGQGHISIRVDDVIETLVERGPVLFLESQSADHPASNISYIAALPESSVVARGDDITVTDDEGEKKFQKNPWEAFREYRDEYPGWQFGYLGYDLKNHIEELDSANPDPVRAPDMFFFNPGLLLSIDYLNDDMQILKGDLPIMVSLDHDVEHELDFDRVESSVRKADYLDAIREAQHRIKEGDFYEVNLSHQLSMDFAGDPYVLFKKMKEIGPVPFSAFLAMPDLKVCCASPERFMARRGARIFSQPIKGTIHRGQTAEEDFRLKQKLTNSEKDRAENLMIVDLVRNDFSKVAVKNSVKVPGLFDIQTFGTVHQMVSTVEAQTDGTDPVDILRACFPMGSMTGAPKISAMQCIEELESYRRGVYSGAIGYIKPDGDFDFNVVIRTALMHKDRLYYSVGGAITGDSDPEAEWHETLVKARALTALMDRNQFRIF